MSGRTVALSPGCSRVVEDVFLRLCLTITAGQPASPTQPRQISRERLLVREYSAIRSCVLYTAAMLADVPLQLFAVNEKPVRHW